MIIARAPKAIELDGRLWPIQTDFRRWVQFERCLLDSYLPPEVKAEQILENLFEAHEIPDSPELVTRLVWFWKCGLVYGDDAQGEGTETTRQAYDYELDAPYLYAAFMADYNMDIEAIKYLHWWKFRALMLNLRPENLFCHILEYRGANLSKLKGEERKRYEKLKKHFALPPSADEQDRNAVIMAALKSDGDIAGALWRAGLA